MSLAKQAITTAAALKVLDRSGNEKEEGRMNQNPSNLKEAFLARPLLWVAVIGIGGYAIYRIAKAVGKSVGKGKGEGAEQKQDVKEFEKTQVQTYPDGSYFGFADAIYAARHGNNVLGTDEDAIYAVFSKMNNDLDIAKLFKAFGSKRLSFSFQSAGLGGYISDEMSDDEISKLNSILSRKNIKYRF
jgi:hypothetical protein